MGIRWFKFTRHAYGVWGFFRNIFNDINGFFRRVFLCKKVVYVRSSVSSAKKRVINNFVENKHNWKHRTFADHGFNICDEDV